VSAAPASARARPSALGAWKLAVRLPTLTAAVTPVLVGSAAAIRDDEFAALPAIAALLGALALQVGANLANDVFDFKKGADTSERLGPPRAAAMGWLSSRQVLAGMWAAFGFAMLMGVYLTFVAGWEVVAIGLASIAAAIAYTGGPWPFGYHGLGDLFTFVFFGVVAVCGTYFVQAEALTGFVVLASVAVGCTVTAILVVNNLRDLATDRAAKKTTLAVLMGDRATRWYYAALLLAPFALVGVLDLGLAALLVLPALPLGGRLIGQVLGGLAGPGLNPVLKATARYHFAFGALMSIAIAIS
jgi:1,4-dihydroxy-2-naphthoate octaprenyltransferase